MSRKMNKKKYTLDELRALYEDFKPKAILDFHDFGVLNENSIKDIYSKFLDESIDFDQLEVLIVTGKGEVVKPLVKRLLAKDKRVAVFRRAGRFQGGDGAFEVELHKPS